MVVEEKGITIKAVQINGYGGVEVLSVVADLAVPKPGKDQLLVDVRAASINPFDTKLMQGYMVKMIPLQFPVTLGGDFSGVVTTLGEGVNQFALGDEVYGGANILSGGTGAFAQLALVKIANISKKPKSASFEEAAGYVLAGVSALQALEDHIKLEKGQKILVHGGTGGIGHIAIQIAKALGAYVITTVSSSKIDMAKHLGADEVIDYTTQDFSTLIKDVDAVFDVVGSATCDKSFGVLKKGGIIVSMVGKPNPELAVKFGVTSIGQGTKVNTDHLVRLASYIDSGKIHIHVDKVFPFDQIKQAFVYQMTGHPKGKVVVMINET